MAAETGGKRSVSAPRLACALAAFLALPSCFTTMLWETAPEPEGRVGRAPSGDDDSPLRRVLLRILLTPFALALDCVTWPAQEWMHEDDDEGDRRDPAQPIGC